ncbi:DNA-binding protein [Leptolyngbya boryana CZ1]|uniref:DNA-binding protein n=1 Tax=Leptolyngbya boryana CZ1 TaxID=3060204 RepID=A0AA97AVD5_LEPBY|nr:DNA-binding protein [Leptolyngbya boryana]WNZ45221.1 DNA-binding protein [Leptolyngbya boryana CZ1]
MAKDLTTSPLARQNILNNSYALEKLNEHLGLGGTLYNGELLFTKNQLVEIFGISESTIEKYLSSHHDELAANGYTVLRGRKLKEFKALLDVAVTDYGNKSPALGVFTFRATLNLAMVLVESELARSIRSRILDIVIDVMAERSGGHTKYINQRDCNYVPAAYQEFSYRKAFADALDYYVKMGKVKYGIYTNKVYHIVFRENAQEYKQILNLGKNDSPRDTMYAEVLKAIASLENGLASEIKAKFEELGRQLKPAEVDVLFEAADNNPFLKPIIEDARIKMASRDLGFRDALHQKLEAYIQSVPESDFERFLGEASHSLEEQLSDPEILAVFKRLKDR